MKEISTNVDIESPPKKILHLDFVLLGELEYEKLTTAMGGAAADEYVAKLNSYLGSTGKKYKSHYHTVLSWWQKDGSKKPVVQAKDIDISKIRL